MRFHKKSKSLPCQPSAGKAFSSTTCADINSVAQLPADSGVPLNMPVLTCDHYLETHENVSEDTFNPIPATSSPTTARSILRLRQRGTARTSLACGQPRNASVTGAPHSFFFKTRTSSAYYRREEVGFLLALRKDQSSCP